MIILYSINKLFFLHFNFIVFLARSLCILGVGGQVGRSHEHLKLNNTCPRVGIEPIIVALKVRRYAAAPQQPLIISIYS